VLRKATATQNVWWITEEQRWRQLFWVKNEDIESAVNKKKLLVKFFWCCWRFQYSVL